MYNFLHIRLRWDAGGNITDETVARHSRMVVSFGKTLDKILLKAADVPQREFIIYEKKYSLTI